MKTVKLLLSLVLVALVSACATVQKPAFDASTEKLDFSETSYVLIKAKIDHAVKPSYNPNFNIVLHVEEPEAKKKAQRFNFLAKGDELRGEKAGPTEVLFRGALKPGEYVLKGMSAMTRKLLILGTFQLGLDSSFTLQPNEVLYLGDITATTRKREKGEFRAGPMIPLIDQSVAAISGSTFDVLIEDGGDATLNRFKSEYSVLQDQQVDSRVLAPFDRSLLDGNQPEEQEEATPPNELDR